MTGGLWTLPDGDPFDVDAWLSLPPVDVWDNVTLTGPQATVYDAQWRRLELPAFPEAESFRLPPVRPPMPQYPPLAPWHRALLHALRAHCYGSVVITAPQHGTPTGAVWRGGRDSTWQAEVAQTIAEHAARRDQRNVWAIRFGTATLTDAESWLWSTVVMDAAATLLYPHRYPTS